MPKRTLPVDFNDDDDDLSPDELKLLMALRKSGAALPAELAVRTFSLPEEVDTMLGKLKEKQLVDVRQVSGSYGELVSLSKRGSKMSSRNPDL